MNNILVVNINWLGDAVFSTPVFKALKIAYPQARISCLCVPRVAQVLEYCPYIDRIIIVDEKARHRMPWGQWKLISHLRKQKFDAAFLLHRSVTRSMMIFLAGIPLRIGFGKWPGLLTHPVKLNAENIHRSDYYLKVLESFKVKIKDRQCELRLKPEDVENVELKLKERSIGFHEKLVVLNTGGNWDLKRWSIDSFIQLAQKIKQEFNFKILLTGSSKDKDDCERILKAVGSGVVVMAGETSLGESLALYKRAMVVISADSGPLHLANSVGAEVIGIFGPTRYEITGPRGQGRAQILFKEIGCNKAPCYLLNCSNNLCMQAITVSDVFQAFQKLYT